MLPILFNILMKVPVNYLHHQNGTNNVILIYSITSLLEISVAIQGTAHSNLVR